MTMTSNSMTVCRGADQNLKDIKKYPKIEGDKRPLSHQQKNNMFELFQDLTNLFRQLFISRRVQL